MEKRFLFIFFLLISITILVPNIIIEMYILHNIDYSIDIEEITVTNLQELNRSYENLFHLYSHAPEYGWSEELKHLVQENEEAYALVSVHYTVKNNSKKIVMGNLSFQPNFKGKFKKYVKAYNTKHDTYLLYAYPGFMSGLTQNILIETHGMSKEEIYANIIEQEAIVCWSSSIQKNEYEYWATTGERKRIIIKNALR